MSHSPTEQQRMPGMSGKPATDTDASATTRSEQRRAETTAGNTAIGDRISGLAVGRIEAFVDDVPLISIADESAHTVICELAVGAACELKPQQDVGASVCVTFDRCDPSRPFVLGKIVMGLARDEADSSRPLEIDNPAGIVLRCGKGTVLLKPDGTVAIRGTNVATRASHTNRIRGGNVQIN